MGLPKNCELYLRARYEKGQKNQITDVPDVCVGHVTVCNDSDVQTGVTAILPHSGDTFHNKLYAGSDVINGFGKSVGLIQLDTLGTIETPIIMTNTLSVGTATTALVKYMLRKNADIALTADTSNPIVMECNDGRLNDIRGLHVKEEHVMQAIENAEKNESGTFEEGAVGSGTGMICMGLKGGIGSASRTLPIDGKKYTIGVLVMTNFGKAGNLVVGGKAVGEQIPSNIYSDYGDETPKGDKGSVIIIIATDIPLTDRQLKRIAKRPVAALGKVGSYIGHGSGDIAVAFSTANKIINAPPPPPCCGS